MDVVYRSAEQLASAIRSGELSATEVLEAHLDQIAKHNPSLNAVVILDAEGARARARLADEALARGEVWGPLHGVPFTIKDAFAAAGMRSTVGFAPFDFVPDYDSTVVARLKAAGAILMGKTNVAQLLADYQTNNDLFGCTNNPWSPERTPGGSSGGAAAAVAAGMSPFELGTDLSGSVRIPAHFCGVFSLKPTENRVSLVGVVPDPYNTPRSVRIMSCVGPLARTAEDLALIYSIVAGPDALDTEVPPVPLGNFEKAELNGLRIVVAPNFPGLEISSEVEGAVKELAGQLRSAGATVEEAKLPNIDFVDDLENAGALIPIITGVFQPDDGSGSPPTTLANYMEMLNRRDRSIVAWESFFGEWDALLCPPCNVTAFPHTPPGTPLEVDGREVEYWSVSAHTTLFNYTGHPALVMPYKLDSNGLPIGVQFVGKLWSEARLLAIASAVSEITVGAQRPPGY